MSQRGSQRTGGSRKTQYGMTKLRHAVNTVHIPTEKGEAASHSTVTPLQKAYERSEVRGRALAPIA